MRGQCCWCNGEPARRGHVLRCSGWALAWHPLTMSARLPLMDVCRHAGQEHHPPVSHPGGHDAGALSRVPLAALAAPGGLALCCAAAARGGPPVPRAAEQLFLPACRRSAAPISRGVHCAPLPLASSASTRSPFGERFSSCAPPPALSCCAPDCTVATALTLRSSIDHCNSTAGLPSSRPMCWASSLFSAW